MSQRPPCCAPCNDRGICDSERACCLECHFADEEELALPYLPNAIRYRLQREHKVLVARGFPPDEVRQHAEREMEWFRAYCPAWVVAQIDHDHEEYERGHLISREAAY
jgi:hypothetical protein